MPYHLCSDLCYARLSLVRRLLQSAWHSLSLIAFNKLSTAENSGLEEVPALRHTEG